MQDDDFGDDDLPAFGDPLHPDDRLWRHPSELRGVPSPGSRSVPDTVDVTPPPAARRHSGWGAVVASGLVGASAALLAVLATGMGERVERVAPPPTTPPPPSTVQPVSASPPDGAAAVAAVLPSVAHLTVTTPHATVDGSALVIRADGYLLTDAQVLGGGAEHVTATFSDGSTDVAEVVAVDEITQLAVVRVERHDLEPATFGDPADLQVGQLATTLGTTAGGSASISSGVVSSLGERATADAGTPLYDMIRVDAPVPDGVAGGPLVTERGEVVGLTTKSAPSATFGWATPIDDAADIADELVERGEVHHSWLGVEGRRTVEGPQIMVVADPSPAADAGLEVGDVLVSVDGTPVVSMATLVAIIRDRDPGDRIHITYRRDGVEWSCVAVLGRRS